MQPSTKTIYPPRWFDSRLLPPPRHHPAGRSLFPQSNTPEKKKRFLVWRCSKQIISPYNPRVRLNRGRGNASTHSTRRPSLLPSNRSVLGAQPPVAPCRNDPRASARLAPSLSRADPGPSPPPNRSMCQNMATRNTQVTPQKSKSTTPPPPPSKSGRAHGMPATGGRVLRSL